MLKHVKTLFFLIFFMVNSMYAKERPVYVKYVHEIVNQYKFGPKIVDGWTTLKTPLKG